MEDVQMSVEVSASDTAPVLPATTSCSTSHSSPQAMSTDHNYAVSSPTKLRRDVNSLTYRLRSKISALRNVRRRETRLRGKVNDLLYRLKSMQLLTTQTEELLEAYKDIPLALLTGRKGGRYDEDQKQFATTLHFYSPAAYHYARQRLKLLPCPRTIRNWLNTVDGSPGITQQSFDTIAEKTNAGDSASWTYKLCALHVDEMEIKRHVEYDRKTRRLVGFTDIGTGALDSDTHPQATKVLMVVAVSVTGRWRIPLAYYLTDGTSANLQETLLRTVISKLFECGCVAVSVTMDGLPANIKTFQQLGCSFDPDNLVTTFTHPSSPDLSVAAVLDACHMMKLARNTLAEYQVLTVPEVGKVKWQHIEKLHKVQVEQGLKLGNKLSQSHIHYKTQKMKVKLAVQVLSASCAKALEYLRTSGLPDFHDSQPTEVFLRKLDRLFDLLNSRSKFGKGFKRAIGCDNTQMNISFLKDVKTFLLHLQDSTGRWIVETKRKTFVLGLCVTIDSVCHLLQTLVTGNGINGVKLSYLLTYRLSQDNIETMFAIIRRRGGWNNNPTALQFKYTYRAILCHIGVAASSSANVMCNATDDILSVSNDDDGADDGNADVFVSDHSYCSHDHLQSLTPYVQNVSAYIAGFVVRKLLPKLKCAECRELLVGVADSSCCWFLQLKDNGGLVKPSEGVIQIVHSAERSLRALVAADKPVHALARLGEHLEVAVMSDLDCRPSFKTAAHTLDTADGIDNHVYSLVRQIVRFYLRIRTFHIVKSWNDDGQGVNVRQKMTKLVLFKNQ